MSIEKNANIWTEKYRPKSVKDMIGSKQLIISVAEFIQKFNEHKKNKNLKDMNRSLLIIGSPGIGKTTIVYAIANDYDLDVKELNASDTRRKDDLIKELKDTMSTMSLLSNVGKVGRLILIDEVDGMSGNEDRGGIQALKSLIPTSRYPVILIANFNNDKIKSLAEISDVVEIKKPSQDSIKKMLLRILECEKIKYEESALDKISAESNGDFRSAINDLQLIIKLNGDLTMDALNINTKRDVSTMDEETFLKIFNANSVKECRDSIEEIDLTPDQLLMWIGDNLIRYYKNSFTINPVMNASKVLEYTDRIKDFKLMGYFYRYIASIGIFNPNKNGDIVKSSEKPNWRTHPLQPTKIIEKIQNVMHYSTQELMQDFLPFIIPIMQKNPKVKETILNKLQIDEDDWIKEFQKVKF